jgi:hypothetical protein
MAVRMALVAIMMGYSVLVHCRAGKHRSGAVVVFLLALLMGTDLDTAMHTYFDRHRDLTRHDQASAPLQICALCGHLYRVPSLHDTDDFDQIPGMSVLGFCMCLTKPRLMLYVFDLMIYIYICPNPNLFGKFIIDSDHYCDPPIWKVSAFGV